MLAELFLHYFIMLIQLICISQGQNIKTFIGEVKKHFFPWVMLQHKYLSVDKLVYWTNLWDYGPTWED